MESKDKSMCQGCRNDYYNHNRPDGCWSFESATIVKRIRVGVCEPPPYSKKRAGKYLSCFRPDGFSMLALDDCRIKR